MFGPNISNTITLSSVLGNISKGLGILNQAIPLYKEIKPMIESSKKVMRVLQELKINNPSNNKTTIDIEENTNKKIVNYESQSTPVFFQ